MADRDRSTEKRVKWPEWLMPLFVVGLLVAPVSLWWYLGWRPAEKAWASSLNDGRSNSEKFGTYGDGFGAVNSLASSLALGGVAIALLLQWREQRDARQEAEKARTDLEKSREHEADLAMLAALIHAEAALMHHQSSTYDQMEAEFKKIAWVSKEARDDRYKIIQRAFNLTEQHKLNLTNLVEQARSRMGCKE